MPGTFPHSACRGWGRRVLATGFRLRSSARLRRAFGRLLAPALLLFAGPKRRNPEKWPGSIRRNYKRCYVEDGGATPAYTIYVVATPRRIWKLREWRIAPALLCSGCCFCALGARCCSRGPSVAVRRGRRGRAAGIAREGDAFSTGQESGRKARPRLTHFPSKDGRKAPPRGALSLWLLSLDSGASCPPPFGPALPFARAPARA